MKLLTSFVVLCVLGCGGKSDKPKEVPKPTKPKIDPKDQPEGLAMVLTDGQEAAPAFDRAKIAAAQKLGDAEVKTLLGRTKPLPTDPKDLQAFAIRPASQPAPRTGDTVKTTFPAPAASLLPPSVTDANAKDVKVTRYMPEGKVPIVPEVSITFSQPMVAVTSQDAAASVVPAKMTPQPKGRWRWLGTRTLLFDPEVRMPQATTYKVEIPAGTKSAAGIAMSAPSSFTFETPPPTLISSMPGSGPQKLDVPMFVHFDQKIDPKTVLSQIKVAVTSGFDSKPIAIRMMDAAEIEKDISLKLRVETLKKDEQGDRWIAFRSAQKLPADAQIEVTIPAGTSSAEGPNKTTEAQSFSFRTYPPLKLQRSYCGYYESKDCRPGTPFVFEFNNPLDEEKFDEKLVTIEPATKGVKAVVSGDNVHVVGLQTARTKYTITVSSNLVDEFGQSLGKQEKNSFTVGEPYPTFFGPNDLVVLDPMAPKPTFDVFTAEHAGLAVKLYKVTARDYPAYIDWERKRYDKNRPPVPGQKAFDQVVKITVGQEPITETKIDLAPALTNGKGHVIAIVEPSPWKEQGEVPQLTAWIQGTKIGIDASSDTDDMYTFATDLATGKPLASVAIEMFPSGKTATTNDQGQAQISLPAPTAAEKPHYLLAKSGDDTAILPGNYYNWSKRGLSKHRMFYVTDDRQMYRPGETVSIKGWIRDHQPQKGGDIGFIDAPNKTVTYKVFDSRGNEIAKGTTELTEVGGFSTTFVLPTTPNLGYTRIEFRGAGEVWEHSVRVEEFRRPEFEVSASSGTGPFLIGGGGDVTISGKYFTGQALPGADVNWQLNASPSSFTPPNRDEYSFGDWVPWWGGYGGGYGRGRYDYDDEGYGYGRRYNSRTHVPNYTHKGKTDGTGSHTLHIDFLSSKPSVPMSVTAYGTITDVNRQGWSANTTILVHAASLYAGLKAKKPFVDKGTPYELDVIGVDIDGKIATGAKIDVKAVRMDWQQVKGRYEQKEVDPQACAVTIASDAGHCKFATKEGGTYNITATITDKEGRQNTSKLTFWVSGGDEIPSREVRQETAQLIPDKKDYAPGNTAELMIQSPFFPAEGVVTWRRSGIVKTERVTLTGPSKVITVPITDAMTPNLYVQVDLVGAAARQNDKGDPDPKLPKRPAYAVGSLYLSIPPKHRALTVTVKPAAVKVSPAEKTSVAIEVKDAAGQPVANAEALVMVMDEAILSLTGHKHGDPIDTFYSGRDAGASDAYFRQYVKLAKLPNVQTASNDDPPPPEEEDRPDDGDDESGGTGTAMALEEGKMGKKDSDRAEGQYKMKKSAEAPAAREQSIALARNAGILGGLADKKPGFGAPDPEPAPIAVRTNFNPLAVFAPAVKTDASGKATVEVAMPDNLTRYRIVVIAVAGAKQYGKGESNVTARLPLMIRPSPPRFLNFGDKFQLPVVVQNQTDQPMTVQLATATVNLALTDGAGRSVTVPANDRVEVQFPAAAEMAGTARFQIVGVSGNATDAAELSLPVWTPATTEAFATYGVVDKGATSQPIAMPPDVVTQFGGIEVTTASTNLQALTDAMIYLVHYPYDCAEQRSSRILGIATLRDVLEAFKVKDLPSRAQMEASVAADVKHLAQMQHGNGGFGFWDNRHDTYPYLTAHVIHALARAQKKGFDVPKSIIDKARPYLKDVESHYDSTWPKDVRWAMSAYALYVRKLIGETDIAKAKKLYAEAGGADKLSLETDAWLLSVFAGNAGAADERAAIVRHAMNKVSETAGAANFTTSYADGGHLLLASDRRVDSIMLEALISDQPKHDLIPKLVTGLLGHRKRGRWLNTQENTFALVALDKYFQTYEKATPNFVSRVWLGNDYAGDFAFKGRTTTYHQINIPMADVASHDKQAITIQKDGAAGRLYYRIGMNYAPASLKLEAADYGFAVERKYEGVDDKKDVTRDAQGIWHIKAGARVRVTVSMANENRRYHVALVDPLPAGLEPLNSALAITGPTDVDRSGEEEDGDEGYTRGGGSKGRGRYWWWYGPWYEHENLRDDRVEAFASYLYEGVHKYVYTARATTPGTFVVPPPKAEEMYMPETFGRGASDKVIVE